jgi:hypothetical protein
MAKIFNVYAEQGYMKGPFTMTPDSIAKIPDDAIGVYVLAESCDQHRHKLTVYVGRGAIKVRLSRHANGSNAAAYFAYRPLASRDAAYLEECRLFHKYGKTERLRNRKHPERPAGRYDLPLCSEQGCRGEP